MSFNPGDPVLACLQVMNFLAVDQTDDSKRLYRDTVQAPNKWQSGDTIKIKDTTFKIFGSTDSDLTTGVILSSSTDSLIGCTTTGQGTGEVTVTLTGTAPDGDTICVYYRVGVPCTYDKVLQNRGNDRINIHKVDINNAPLNYVDVYNKPHQLAGSNATLNTINSLDGMSIQTNPPG
jgi:hypothetical protein